MTTPPAFQWIRPPWRDRDETSSEDDGCWPWCGDIFLAAVRIVNVKTQKEHWEYAVLSWSENGLEADGEAWSAWGEGDIEWIARIPEPANAG